MGSNGHGAAVEQQDWELSKENYQPLKSGRKPGVLKESALSEKKLSVEQQRQFHIDAIDNYKGEDPLEAWLSYIKWNQDTFKAGGHKAEMLPLLERCTRELQGSERYHKDIRYLRVWIQYADCLPDPSDVFAFLKEHNIGQEHALFHIAHALFLEQRGNYSAADNAYQQGINRLAVPLDRLQAKYKEFENRMAQRIQRKAQEQSSTEEDIGHPERKSLAVLGGRRTGGGTRPAGLPSQKRKAIATPGKDNAPAGGSLAIFVDEEFGGPAASAPPIMGGGLPAPAAAPSWSTLPTFEQARKENTQKAASWGGQRIKQKTLSAPPPAPVLEIPLDPEFEARELDAAARQAAAEANQVTLRQRLDSGGIDEQLVHDPLRLHRGPLPAQNVAPPQPSAAPVREQVLACNEAALVDAAGDGVSFEELRAQAWLVQHPVVHPPAVVEVVETLASVQAVGAVECPAHTPFDQPAPVAVQQQPAASDVTMTTRGAFDAVNAMFGGGMPLGSSEDVAGMEPTMTISTKDAFAAINSMFKNSFMPSDLSSMDPTMTLSTKAAFDALNSAFAGSANAAAATGPQPVASSRDPSAIFVRSDTSLLSGSAQEAASAAIEDVFGGGFDIREDTVFISRGDVPAAGSPGDCGLSIREDTVFINRGAVENTSSGFDIREDTVFLKPHASSAADGGGGGGLDIREDTIFIGGARAASGCESFEETAPLERDGDDGAASKWGFVPGDDETLQFGPSSQGQQLSTSLTADLHGMNLTAATGLLDDVTSPEPRAVLEGEYENDENALPSMCAPRTNAVLRDIRSPEVAAGALQPIPLEQYAARGIDLEEDAEAEAALYAAPLQEEAVGGDDFLVFEDTDATEEAEPTELVNPFAAAFQGHVLSMLEPPVAQWPGVVSLDNSSEESDALAVFKRAKGTVTLVSRAFQVHRSIGAGAYATVYEATDAEGEVCALKVESPPCPWEWYICKVVAGRVPAESRAAFVDPSALFLGGGASVLQMPCGRRGSLQDLLNAHLACGQRPDETIAARIAVLLLTLMGDLHTARVLHNDIKPDNFLISLAAPSAGGDENAAPVLGLQLIDFGRSVDLELLPSGAALTGDSGTDSFRCAEMREGRPWLWQADAYGVAGVLHCLLFGEYMDVERVVETVTGKASLRIRTQLRRYWQAELWGETLATLLNHSTLDASCPPPWSQLAAKFEEWLDSSRDVLRKERTELNKLATMVPPM